MKHYKWELLFSIPRAHKFFRDTNSGRVAVADNSGYEPDRTDDGVLWVDFNRPLRITPSSGGSKLALVFNVTKERTGETGYTCSDYLVADTEKIIDLFPPETPIIGSKDDFAQQLVAAELTRRRDERLGLKKSAQAPGAFLILTPPNDAGEHTLVGPFTGGVREATTWLEALNEQRKARDLTPFSVDAHVPLTREAAFEALKPNPTPLEEIEASLREKLMQQKELTPLERLAWGFLRVRANLNAETNWSPDTTEAVAQIVESTATQISP